MDYASYLRWLLRGTFALTMEEYKMTKIRSYRDDERFMKCSTCEHKSGQARGLPIEAVCPECSDTMYRIDFEYPEPMLASLRDALRPGGTLVVIDFEKIPGRTREFIMGHVRAGKQQFIDEIEGAGFVLEEEIQVEGLEENYVLRFRKPATQP